MSAVKFSFSILIAIIFTQISFAQDKPVQMQGSDKYFHYQSKDNTDCYVFEKVTVISQNFMTKSYKEGMVSQKVTAYKRNADTNPKDGCQQTDEIIFDYETKDEVSFTEISALGNLIFIDLNYYPDSQRMIIFDGSDKKKKWDNEHTEWAGIKTEIKNDLLYFNEWSKKKGLMKNCREGKKWVKQGLGVDWIQPFKLNLKTMKKVPFGALRCTAIQ